MQLVIQEASEIMIAVALVVAAMIIVRYTRRRTAELPPEEKKMGQPLYVSALGILMMAAASTMNFEMNSGAIISSFDWIYYLIAMCAAASFAIAALLILDWRKWLVAPIILLAIGFIYIFTARALLPDLSTGMVLGPMTLVLYIVPLGLFGFLFKTTGRPTTLSLLILLIGYISYPLTTLPLYFLPPIIVAFRLFAASTVIVAFYMPDLGISGEFFGYALSYATVGFWFSHILSLNITDTVLISIFSAIALSATLGIGTAAFTYARWKHKPSWATMTLCLYLLIGSYTWLIVALRNVGFEGLEGAWPEYIILFFGISLSPMLLNLSAFLALDWNRILLLPVLIMMIPVVLLFSSFPTPMDSVPMSGMVFAISGMLQIIIPMGLYGLIWWRMRKAGAPGRSRALFLALGLVATIFANAGGQATTLIPSLFLLASYFIFWVGITGRADRMLGTI